MNGFTSELCLFEASFSKIYNSLAMADGPFLVTTCDYLTKSFKILFPRFMKLQSMEDSITKESFDPLELDPRVKSHKSHFKLFFFS